MINKIIVFFERLWLRGIKNWWSKLRWYSKSKEESYDVPLVTTDEELIETARDVYAHFNWEMDGIKDAFDTYYPIPYAYNLYFQAKQLNGTFSGDCDDHHGVILHILNQNNYNAAAITLATIPVTESHTMTTFKRLNENGSVEYYVVNYTRLLGPYNSLQEFVDTYGTPVRYWCLQKYDYDKGMYYNIDKEDF